MVDYRINDEESNRDLFDVIDTTCSTIHMPQKECVLAMFELLVLIGLNG